MAKKSGVLSTLIKVAIWLTGILVALAVGFGMIGKVLVVPGIPEIVTYVAGWIVVVTTLLGIIMALFDR